MVDPLDSVKASLDSITSIDENLDTSKPVPKLSAIALAKLPSPRAVISRDKDGNPTKLARLIYSVPVSSMRKYFPVQDIPAAKIEKGPYSFGGYLQQPRKHADFVPWVPYGELPDAKADTLKDMFPLYTYRFERPHLPVKHDGILLTSRDELRMALLQSIHRGLTDMDLSADAALLAIQQCAIDFEIRPQESCVLDVYWPCRDVPFPMHSFGVGGIRPKLLTQGQRCPATFKTLAFTGLSMIDPIQVVRTLDKALRDNALVVDVWQHETIFKSSEKSHKTPIKLQQYAALVLLLDMRSDGSYPLRIPTENVHRKLEALPGYFEIVPGRFARLIYPERISRCSLCLKKDCHSRICSKVGRCDCEECRYELYGSEDDETFSEDDSMDGM